MLSKNSAITAKTQTRPLEMPPIATLDSEKAPLASTERIGDSELLGLTRRMKLQEEAMNLEG